MTETTQKSCCSTLFCPNVGKADRILRLAIGFVLIALVFAGPKTLWGLLGIPLVISGLLGWCGAYKLTKINTCCAGKSNKAEGTCCGGTSDKTTA